MDVADYVSVIRENEVAREFASLIERLLFSFVDKSDTKYYSKKTLQFPHLSSYFRLLIHCTARSFNLRHGSSGFGTERHTKVTLTENTWLPLLKIEEIAFPSRTGDQRDRKWTVNINTTTYKNRPVRNLGVWKEERERCVCLKQIMEGEGEEEKDKGNKSAIQDDIDDSIYVLPMSLFSDYLHVQRPDADVRKNLYNSKRDGPLSRRQQDKSNYLSHILCFEYNLLPVCSSNTPEIEDASSTMTTATRSFAPPPSTLFGDECLGIRPCYPGNSAYIAIFSTPESVLDALGNVTVTSPGNVNNARLLADMLVGDDNVWGLRMGIGRRPEAKNLCLTRKESCKEM